MKVALCAWAASSGSTAQAAPRVRLKGTAHLDVHVARDGADLVISGRVIDDASRPVLGARVGVVFVATLAAGASVHPPFGAPIPASAALPQPCSELDVRPQLDSGGRLVLPTDDVARFCVRVSLASPQCVARMEALASRLVEGSTLDVPLDASRNAVTLRFDPEPSSLSLDDESTELTVVAATDEDGVTAAASGLRVSLSNEAGVRLADETTDPTGRARFRVDSARLGALGEGELRLTFDGDAAAAPAVYAQRVQRRTRVDLVAPSVVEGRLPAGWPEDGVNVQVLAAPRCARLGCRGAPTGMIEARLGEHHVIGAASLERGEARLAMTFAAPPLDRVATTGSAAPEVPIMLRYLPDAPWFEAAGEKMLVLPVRGPSPWRKVPLVLAASAVVAWLALVRSSARPRVRRRAPLLRRPAPRGEPVQLVRAAPRSQGWTGGVTDAHDGTPVSHARVAIERPRFERVDIVAEVVSDPDGRFALPRVDTRPEDQLVVRGRLHAMIRGPLPPCGELAVALVLRRRALLDQLVSWARRRGTPYDTLPEPTPGHVWQTAASDVTVARWARALEHAAYSGVVVDEDAQVEVDRLAPPDYAKDAVDGARRRSV
jgi:hypothetical protein